VKGISNSGQFAKTSTDDPAYERATELSRSLLPDRIITTDEVLSEYLAFFYALTSVNAIVPAIRQWKNRRNRGLNFGKRIYTLVTDRRQQVVRVQHVGRKEGAGPSVASFTSFCPRCTTIGIPLSVKNCTLRWTKVDRNSAGQGASWPARKRKLCGAGPEIRTTDRRRNSELAGRRAGQDHG